MAAPMVSKIAVQQFCKLLITTPSHRVYIEPLCRHMGYISNLRQSLFNRGKTEELTPVTGSGRLPFEEKQTTTGELTQVEVKKRSCIEEHRPYQPPANVESRIQAITTEVYGQTDNWRQVQLTDRHKKFHMLTKLMSDLDHEIPNMDLHNMNSVQDVITFFKVEVRDISTLEDLAKLDLPKNLHMNLEPIRFHPDTDKIYGGVSAYPGRATVISSVKYRRKYKGYDGGDAVNDPESFKYK